MNRYLPLGIAAVFVLAGCAPSTPTSDPAPVPTVTVTATPDAAAPLPDFGFTFFEQAQIGSTWDEMSAQLHYPVGGAAECPWYGGVWNSELTTTYAYTSPQDAGTGASMFYTHRLAAADGAPFPRNAENVGVGSTQEAVVAAYPDAIVGSIDDLGVGTITTITVDDPDSDSKYVFGISDGSAVVNLLQWGPRAGTQWSHLCTGF